MPRARPASVEPSPSWRSRRSRNRSSSRDDRQAVARGALRVRPARPRVPPGPTASPATRAVHGRRGQTSRVDLVSAPRAGRSAWPANGRSYDRARPGHALAEAHELDALDVDRHEAQTERIGDRGHGERQDVLRRCGGVEPRAEERERRGGIVPQSEDQPVDRRCTRSCSGSTASAATAAATTAGRTPATIARARRSSPRRQPPPRRRGRRRRASG